MPNGRLYRRPRFRLHHSRLLGARGSPCFGLLGLGSSHLRRAFLDECLDVDLDGHLLPFSKIDLGLFDERVILRQQLINGLGDLTGLNVRNANALALHLILNQVPRQPTRLSHNLAGHFAILLGSSTTDLAFLDESDLNLSLCHCSGLKLLRFRIVRLGNLTGTKVDHVLETKLQRLLVHLGRYLIRIDEDSSFALRHLDFVDGHIGLLCYVWELLGIEWCRRSSNERDCFTYNPQHFSSMAHRDADVHVTNCRTPALSYAPGAYQLCVWRMAIPTRILDNVATRA